MIAVAERKREEFQPMVNASDLAVELQRRQTALPIRIAQLEQFIRDAGLEVPPCRRGWELS